MRNKLGGTQNRHTDTITEIQGRRIGYALIFALAAALISLALFGWLAEEVFEGDARAFDMAVRSTVHLHATPALTAAMSTITWIGSPEVIGGLFVIACLMFWRAHWHRALAWLVVTMAGAVVLDVGLKVAFHRHRPVAFYGVSPASYSFPSGHALGSFCFYGIMAALIAHRIHRRGVKFVVWLTAVLLIAVIGFSRIYLGVHYPTDVIAGYAAAGMWVGALVSVDRYHRARHPAP